MAVRKVTRLVAIRCGSGFIILEPHNLTCLVENETFKALNGKACCGTSHNKTSDFSWQFSQYNLSYLIPWFSVAFPLFSAQNSISECQTLLVMSWQKSFSRMWSNVFCLQVNRVNLEICTLTCLQHPVPIDGLILEKNQKIQRQLDNPRTIYFIILLLLSNRALYWFTAVGSETIFYSNKCY